MEGEATPATDRTVQELAFAMREGLESRRVFGAGECSQASLGSLDAETRNAMRFHADVLGFPPVAKAGPFGKVMRCLRALAKIVIRPWLGVQTEFNRLSLETLQNTFREIEGLKTRLEQCAETIERYYQEAVSCELGPHGKIARAGLWFNPPIAVDIRNTQPEIIAVKERILEHMFVHTRLPPPPARVLDLGCAESICALEMASFGYEVQGVDLRFHPVQHPKFSMVRADIAHLPFLDGVFDVAVSLSTLEHVGLDAYGPVSKATSDQRAVDEVRRALRPGGRFILTVPFGQPATTRLQRVYDASGLDHLLRDFRRMETLFGIRERESWSLTTDISQAEKMKSAERVSAVALVVAEKSGCKW
jgi:SAM-dependent methyltransferase